MSTHNLAHTIRLYPTRSQETFFKKACGCARVAYNYGLAKYQEIRATGEKPNILEIKKKFNSEKKVLFPWMSETNKDANQQPFTNLQSAFNRFFKKQGGFPVFKKKGIKDSFYISNDKFGVEEKKFWVPRLGWIEASSLVRKYGASKGLMPSLICFSALATLGKKDRKKLCNNTYLVRRGVEGTTEGAMRNGMNVYLFSFPQTIAGDGSSVEITIRNP
jgi:transposase